MPSLWRLGYRPRLLPDLRLRDPGTRRIATLMAPATLGVAAVQVNVVINSSFASLISDGALSWLSYAFRLMQLPIGVFGVAVGTTSLTQLSRDAAAEDWDRMRATLAARPAHGAVPDRSVDGRAGAAGRADHPPDLRARPVLAARDASRPRARCRATPIGLVAYAAIKVVAPAFYALGRTRVPLIASVSAVAREPGLEHR